MPKIHEKPPKVALPPCGGCDKCMTIDPNALYALAADGKYYCRSCFEKGRPGWLQNESGFRGELDEGHKWETIVYARLKADLEPHGIPVTLTPKSVRANVSQRHKYRQEEDINIGGFRVEVHARKYAFTGKEDHPREREIMTPVKKVARWGDRKPMCFIIVSKATGAMIVASVQKTHKDWQRWMQPDPGRGYTEEVYGCPVSLMTNYDDFIATIKERMVKSERRLGA
jgi:hypothetical protein